MARARDAVVPACPRGVIGREADRERGRAGWADERRGAVSCRADDGDRRADVVPELFFLTGGGRRRLGEEEGESEAAAAAAAASVDVVSAAAVALMRSLPWRPPLPPVSFPDSSSKEFDRFSARRERNDQNAWKEREDTRVSFCFSADANAGLATAAFDSLPRIPTALPLSRSHLVDVPKLEAVP